mgnify:CR=1 FL=1
MMNSRQEFRISWRTRESLIKYATISLLLLFWAPTNHAFELTGNFWEFAQATFHVDINGASPSGTTDFLFAKSFLDLYQLDVVNTTNLQFDLSSSQLDTYLLVVEILPDQSLGSLVLENDDRSAFSFDSRIQQLLPPRHLLDRC